MESHWAAVAVSSSGNATLNLAASASGIFTISAEYSGGTNYLASTGSKQTAIYQHSIRDDATGKYLLFNSTAGLNGLIAGAWYYKKYMPKPSAVRATSKYEQWIWHGRHFTVPENDQTGNRTSGRKCDGDH